MGALASVLLLADGRLPVGGHAHSGGIEAAIADGRVRDAAGVEAFTIGRLHTTGLVEAALVAATVRRLRAPGAIALDVLAAVDAEADARIPSAPLRAASRRLGRQLTRLAGSCWPDAVIFALGEIDADGPHQPVALGGVAVAAGVSAFDAAAVALHHAATTPIQAATKIAGLDPSAMAAMTAGLGPTIEALAELAGVAAEGPLAELPCAAAPLIEIAATRHADTDGRLFAT
jgi:urease accessory protein